MRKQDEQDTTVLCQSKEGCITLKTVIVNIILFNQEANAHVLCSSYSALSANISMLSAPVVVGHHNTGEVDIGVLSDDEQEVREEVAEAVQAARKEQLRDDLLGMVCPSDWTIQAPEPPGRYSKHST